MIVLSYINPISRKLLKEHESKYEPLGHDETFKIMEEILAMQIGLNTTGVSILIVPSILLPSI